MTDITATIVPVYPDETPINVTISDIGIQGQQGSTGIPGSAVYKGDTGIQGLTGITGFTGSQGIKGVTGAQGGTGIQGEQGFTGIQGETGVQEEIANHDHSGLTGSGGQFYAENLLSSIVPHEEGSLQVSEAGTSAINGLYLVYGITNGKTEYRREFGLTYWTIVWSSDDSRWYIQDESAVKYYYSGADVITPDLVPAWSLVDTPYPAMIVSGAGTSSANGNYWDTGQITNGKLSYYNDSLGEYIVWDNEGNVWWLGYYNQWYYSAEDVETPDLVQEWSSSSGDNPAPTVVYGQPTYGQEPYPLIIEADDTYTPTGHVLQADGLGNATWQAPNSYPSWETTTIDGQVIALYIELLEACGLYSSEGGGHQPFYAPGTLYTISWEISEGNPCIGFMWFEGGEMQQACLDMWTTSTPIWPSGTIRCLGVNYSINTPSPDWSEGI